MGLQAGLSDVIGYISNYGKIVTMGRLFNQWDTQNREKPV